MSYLHIQTPDCASTQINDVNFKIRKNEINYYSRNTNELCFQRITLLHGKLYTPLAG